MRLDGHLDVTRLREELDAWRERKQERWLAEIPYRRIPLPCRRSTQSRAVVFLMGDDFARPLT